MSSVILTAQIIQREANQGRPKPKKVTERGNFYTIYFKTKLAFF